MTDEDLGKALVPQSRAALDESQAVKQRGYFSGVICQADIPAQGYSGLSKDAPLPSFPLQEAPAQLPSRGFAQ